MSEEKLRGLLGALISAQDAVTCAAELVPDRETDDKLVTAYKNARNAILSEFAALRQQRDELAEALKSIGADSCCQTEGCCIDDPYCYVMTARAALASIEETE